MDAKKIGFFFWLFIYIIILGMFSSPVTGKEYPYNPWIMKDDISMGNISIETNYTFLEFNNPVYTPSEMKLSTDLLHLVSPGKDPRVNPEIINSTIQTLREANEYKFAGETISENGKNGYSTKAITDMVYVTIAITPGISTHTLDSYLHPPIIREEDYIGLYNKWDGNRVDAWVEFSKLKEITNISDVQQISPVILGSYNSGSANTEGDEVLHSDLVRYLQKGVNGSDNKIGVITDGAEHKQHS